MAVKYALRKKAKSIYAWRTQENPLTWEQIAVKLKATKQGVQGAYAWYAKQPKDSA